MYLHHWHIIRPWHILIMRLPQASHDLAGSKLTTILEQVTAANDATTWMFLLYILSPVLVLNLAMSHMCYDKGWMACSVYGFDGYASVSWQRWKTCGMSSACWHASPFTMPVWAYQKLCSITYFYLIFIMWWGGQAWGVSWNQEYLIFCTKCMRVIIIWLELWRILLQTARFIRAVGGFST